jgi:hypothetical protein
MAVMKSGLPVILVRKRKTCRLTALPSYFKEKKGESSKF